MNNTKETCDECREDFEPNKGDNSDYTCASCNAHLRAQQEAESNMEREKERWLEDQGEPDTDSHLYWDAVRARRKEKLAAFMRCFKALTEAEKLQSVEVLYGNGQARKRMLKASEELFAEKCAEVRKLEREIEKLKKSKEHDEK